MMCYRDRTWCSFYLLCKKASGCDRCLTPKVIEDAQSIGLPISVFTEFPECFVAFFENGRRVENET
jgi:hypothetical protein